MEHRVLLHCIICGAEIHDFDKHRSGSPTWLQKYRVVYWESDRIYLSDISRRKPTDDDLFFRIPTPTVANMNKKGRRWMHVAVLTESDGRYGFVFHDGCWRVLEQRLQGVWDPLVRLFDVFDSILLDYDSEIVFPVDRSPPEVFYIWEHGYGGLLSFANLTYYPWDNNGWCKNDCSKAAQIASEDPFSPSAIADLLDFDNLLSPGITTMTESDQQWRCEDSFARLPPELVLEIATYLPTETFLSLRLISRTFIPLFYCQSFWASRFQPGGEHEFLFEVCRTDNPRDWLALNRISARFIKLYPGIQNRKRIWELAGSLIEKLALEWPDQSTRLPLTRHILRWTQEEVCGNFINPSWDNSGKSGWFANIQQTMLPSNVSRVGVSVLRDGPTTYVVGLQFSYGEQGSTIYLGYTAPRITTFVEVGYLKGFITSVGPRGIHALQIVRRNDCLSQWLGCPDRGCKTRRLVFDGRVKALSVWFDGYKMMVLSAWGKKNPVRAEHKYLDWVLNNRLWFPDIPRPSLNLNEVSFIDAREEEWTQPLCWVQFGGTGGSLLPYLERIRFWVKDEGVSGLEFFYSYDTITKGWEIFSLDNNHGSWLFDFEVDGKRGEFIKKVEVLGSHYLQGIKMSTNWGRTFTSRPGGAQLSNTAYGCQSYRTIEIPSGTIPTGLYAAQSREGFASLGIISEVVQV